MKTKKNEDFILVGHLQVLDEALSSLYSDRNSGQFFLFVRVYEDEDDNTFVLTQVQPSVVLDYIDGKVGLSRFSVCPLLIIISKLSETVCVKKTLCLLTIWKLIENCKMMVLMILSTLLWLTIV